MLQNVEGLGKYGQGGYMCSINQIKTVQNEIHTIMMTKCPYTVLNKDDGIDGFVFDFATLTDFILKMFKLDKIARMKGGVLIAIILDVAYLSRNIQHVTAGIKIEDPRAVNILTGIVIFLEGVHIRE